MGTVAVNGYLVLAAQRQIVTVLDSLPKLQVDLLLGTDLMLADGTTQEVIARTPPLEDHAPLVAWHPLYDLSCGVLLVIY